MVLSEGGEEQIMKIEYNIELTQDGDTWTASCESPLLPVIHGAEKISVLWSVYKNIFDDLKALNDKSPFIDSLELIVNIIETE